MVDVSNEIYDVEDVKISLSVLRNFSSLLPPPALEVAERTQDVITTLQGSPTPVSRRIFSYLGYRGFRLSQVIGMRPPCSEHIF